MYKVVLVDDEEWGLASLKSAFRWEEHGFEVMFASTDPAAAWTVIQKWNPDVVFCDIRMPGMDPEKPFKKQICDRQRICRISVCTGSHQ